MSPDRMRIGVLGAAPSARRTVIRPSRATADTVVSAVAPLEPGELASAESFAADNGIETVHQGPAALLGDEAVDAVYLPAADPDLVRRAIEAGKHVLCERLPADAEGLTAAAHEAGVRLAEDLPHRYHPLLRQTREELDAADVRSASLALCLPLRGRVPVLPGCGYAAVDLVRMLLAGEPEVLAARTRAGRRGVRAVRARLRTEAGVPVRLHVSAWSVTPPRCSLHVRTADGELRVLNPLAPHLPHQLAVRVGGDRAVRHFPRRPGYAYQLDAFAAGEGLVAPDESAATARVARALARQAGSPAAPRG